MSSSDTLHFRLFSPAHDDSILQKMNRLREDQRFCDITLILGTGSVRFQGHRVVLAASSAFLRDQFLLHEGSRELPVAVVPSAEVSHRLLLSCYTGHLEVPLRELVGYLTAASALQMSHVVERCAQAVSQYLDPTLAHLKLERSPETEGTPSPPPGNIKPQPSLACLDMGDVRGEDPKDRDLDSEDSFQMVHTNSPYLYTQYPHPTGAHRRKQRPPTSCREYIDRTFSPAPSPGHSSSGLADSSQDQEVDGNSGEDMYMLAAHHMQGVGGGSLRPESRFHMGLVGGRTGAEFSECGQELLLQRPYLCRKCDRVFHHLDSYVGHLKEHKLYLCMLCGKCFSQKSNLTRHIRVHTGVKPFQCPLCHKTFSQKATLQDHLNLHTGDKPHKCNYCAIHFAHKPGLRRHLKDIHGKSSLQNMFEEVV
ncbi:zinc finger and BTB domain-containing protein 26 [Esox lucius]|uniref:Zinc finger and BTB domain containing 26 n=1 Tax=Esox lucius TaxID=8010 RepID=A0A3P8ZKK2_ESOLU|nr:zinc finger and BTB domain-containing protein 26 [Esox lucius]XP_010875633.1 zinc finger and BTB domain-containing protein 26 [Esox lucius]XP_012992456.1 zinc finger and BTB domain-containing protein 26 [Esox lucius]